MCASFALIGRQPNAFRSEIAKRIQLLRCKIRSIGWSGQDVNDLACIIHLSPAILQNDQLLQGSAESVHEARFVV
jgi:hypothetical protein